MRLEIANYGQTDDNIADIIDQSNQDGFRHGFDERLITVIGPIHIIITTMELSHRYQRIRCGHQYPHAELL